MSNDNKTKRVSKKHECLKISYNDMSFNINNNLYEIGIDEVGRGPLFGRVYCAAVILPKEGDFKYELMKDSKKFTSKTKIQETAKYIKENAIAWTIEYQDENSIDTNNIRQATFMTMHNAVKKIISHTGDNINKTDIDSKKVTNKYYLLVDGNDFKPYVYMNQESSMIEQIPHITIEGGDNKYCCIAAASILAKAERDSYIIELCEKYPKLIDYYALDSNMGYGTKKHIEGIETNGISPWHRKTYGLCRNAKILEKEDFI